MEHTRARRARERTGCEGSVCTSIVMMLLVKGLSTRRLSKADLARWAHAGERNDDGARVLVDAATQAAAACAGPPAARARGVRVNHSTRRHNHRTAARRTARVRDRGAAAVAVRRGFAHVAQRRHGGDSGGTATELRESEGHIALDPRDPLARRRGPPCGGQASAWVGAWAAAAAGISSAAQGGSRAGGSGSGATRTRRLRGISPAPPGSLGAAPAAARKGGQHAGIDN